MPGAIPTGRALGGNSDAAAAQQAFVALLAQPLGTRSSDPQLYREVVRHAAALRERSARLGYRLVTQGRAFRLIREPLDGVVVAPPRPADSPGRRVLALALCAAAACEETGGAPTLQQVSDLVRDLTTAPGSPLSPYDSDSRAARRQLAKAVALLEQWRVVRRRTAEDLVEQWAEGAGGIGAGYEVDREAMLLLLDSRSVGRNVNDRPPPGEDVEATAAVDARSAGSSRTTRLLRALVETPAVLYADLSKDDAELLARTRGLRARDVESITGGSVETRAEGLLLVLPDEPRSPVTVDWPRADTRSWIALLAADAAGTRGHRRPDGTVHLEADQVEGVLAGLVERHGSAMSRAVLEQPDGVRRAVESELGPLGLLRPDGAGGWLLSAAVARYREPSVLGAAGRGGASGDDGLSADQPTTGTEAS